MRVHLLWHVHHANDEDGRARHAATLSGDWCSDEEAGDDIKLLGVYSTAALASSRIVQAQGLPGFRDEPNCFLSEPYEVDRDEWMAGYVVTDN